MKLFDVCQCLLQISTFLLCPTGKWLFSYLNLNRISSLCISLMLLSAVPELYSSKNEIAMVQTSLLK